MVEIRTAMADADLEAVKDLCRGFRLWLYERYHQHRPLIDKYYDPTRYEELLASLPQLHAPPDGAILLATVGDHPAGCVMMKKMDDGCAEMKRMFVDPGFRGQGVAKSLCEALITLARDTGYRVMRLDTGFMQHEAKEIYAKAGFQQRSAYYDPGPDWRDRLVYMERQL